MYYGCKTTRCHTPEDHKYELLVQMFVTKGNRIMHAANGCRGNACRGSDVMTLVTVVTTPDFLGQPAGGVPLQT
jgi:hypothetical protein